MKTFHLASSRIDAGIPQFTPTGLGVYLFFCPEIDVSKSPGYFTCMHKLGVRVRTLLHESFLFTSETANCGIFMASL